MKECIIIFLFIISGLGGSVQAQFDSIFVEHSQKTFSAGLNLKYKSFQAKFTSSDNQVLHIDNRALLPGIRFRYKWLNIVASVPIYDFTNEESITPDAIAFTLRSYPKSFYFQINGQYTSIDQSLDFRPSNFLSSLKNDMPLYSINALGLYLFNKEKIALSSNYSFFHRQKFTAGSWLVSSFVDYYQFQGDSIKLRSIGYPDFLKEYAEKVRFGVGGGFTQSIVLGDFVFNGLVLGGLEYVHFQYEENNQLFRKNTGLTINPKIRFMGSAIYYFNDFYIGLTGENIPDFHSSIVPNSTLDSWNIRLDAGIKF